MRLYTRPEHFQDAGDRAGRRLAVVWQGEPRDARVDHTWPARGDRCGKSLLETLQAADAIAIGPAGAGVGRIVGILELDQAGLVKGRELVELDELELAVVEDHPDDRQVVLDGGHQLEAGKVVAAVAAAHDDGAVGMGKLQADGAVHVPRHRPERAWLAKVLAVLELDEVAKPGK